MSVKKKEKHLLGVRVSGFLCDLTIDLTTAAKYINILLANSVAREREKPSKNNWGWDWGLGTWMRAPTTT